MDGFGQLADVPGAVVELAQDAPAFEAGYLMVPALRTVRTATQSL
jgi:hypothetical protein